MKTTPTNKPRIYKDGNKVKMSHMEYYEPDEDLPADDVEFSADDAALSAAAREWGEGRTVLTWEDWLKEKEQDAAAVRAAPRRRGRRVPGGNASAASSRMRLRLGRGEATHETPAQKNQIFNRIS